MTLGDVVQLKSGGPLMTVISKGVQIDLPVCHCTWFTPDNEIRRGEFLQVISKKVDHGH